MATSEKVEWLDADVFNRTQDSKCGRFRIINEGVIGGENYSLLEATDVIKHLTGKDCFAIWRTGRTTYEKCKQRAEKIKCMSDN